jgi:hypothetical protein
MIIAFAIIIVCGTLFAYAVESDLFNSALDFALFIFGLILWLVIWLGIIGSLYYIIRNMIIFINQLP